MVDEQKIRDLLQAGKTYFAITAETGVSSATIAKIAKMMKKTGDPLVPEYVFDSRADIITDRDVTLAIENQQNTLDDAFIAAQEFIRVVKQNRRRPSVQNEMRVKNAVYGLKVRVVNL